MQLAHDSVVQAFSSLDRSLWNAHSAVMIGEDEKLVQSGDNIPDNVCKDFSDHCGMRFFRSSLLICGSLPLLFLSIFHAWVYIARFNPGIMDRLRRRLFASPVILIVLAGLLASLPVLITGYPLQGHDGRYHPTWAILFSEQFWSGDLFPRWLYAINSGIGDPTFFFYPPLPYYLVVPFAFLDPVDPHGLYRLGIVSSIVFIASGIAAWLWLRELTSRTWLVVLGALLYMFAPYHLALDLYIRGAFAEFCAFVWPPLVLYGLHRIAAGRRWGVVVAALAWGALILTHPPTVIVVAPLVVFYPLVIAESGQRGRAFAKGIAGLLLGSGLAAVYWLPALVHRDYINIDIVLQGPFNYAHHFVVPDFGSPTSYTGGLFWLVLYSALLIAVVWTGRFREMLRSRRGLFLTAIALYAALMMFPAGRIVWEIVPGMASVAFPFRFHLLLGIATVALIAGIDTEGEPRPRTVWFHRAVAFIAALSVPITVLVIANSLDPDSNLYRLNYDRNRRMVEHRAGALEYLPRWAFPADPRSGSVTYRSYREMSRRFGGEPRALVVEGDPVQLVQQSESEYVLTVPGGGEAVCDVNRFYYPGWVAHADGRELPVEPIPELGFIRVRIPPGIRQVRLTRRSVHPEGIGFAISLLSLGEIAALAVVDMRKRRSDAAMTEG